MNSRKAEKPGVEVQISQNPYLFSVRFGDQNEGWIAGLGGVILRSHDSGRTWTYEKLGRVQAVFGIQPFSADVAIAVGEKGLIYATEDGGKSWKQWPGFPTIFTFMRGIAFAPGDRSGTSWASGRWCCAARTPGRPGRRCCPRTRSRWPSAD